MSPRTAAKEYSRLVFSSPSGDDQHHLILLGLPQLLTLCGAGVDASDQPTDRVEQRCRGSRDVLALVEPHISQWLVVDQHLERVYRVELDQAHPDLSFGLNLFVQERLERSHHVADDRPHRPGSVEDHRQVHRCRRCFLCSLTPMRLLHARSFQLQDDRWV